MTSTLTPRLPTELLHEILIQVLGESIHLAVVAPEMSSWNVRVHHTLSAVCSSFRDIMHGISCRVFEYKPDVATSKADGEVPPAEEPPSLASHVHRLMLTLRTLGASIRDPSTLNVPSAYTGYPRVVQGYSLYAGIVGLHCKAARTTPDIYNSTSATLSKAILTLSTRVCGRILPQALGAVLYCATQDEKALEEISVRVVQICTRLGECLGTLENPEDLDMELWDLNTVLLAASLRLLAVLQTDFRVLMTCGHPRPSPAYSFAWLGELPGVWGTISRVNALSEPRARTDEPSAPWVALTPEAMRDLELLVAAWRPDLATTAGP